MMLAAPCRRVAEGYCWNAGAAVGECFVPSREFLHGRVRKREIGVVVRA